MKLTESESVNIAALTDKERLEFEKLKLLELCDDYNWQSFVAIPIKTLTNLLNTALSSTEVEDFGIGYIRDMVSDITGLIAFLASMHETVDSINMFEDRLKQNEA